MCLNGIELETIENRTMKKLLILSAIMLLANAALAAPFVYPVGVTKMDPRMYPGVTLFNPPTGQVVLIDPAGQFVKAWFPPVEGDLLKGAEPILDTPGHILVTLNVPDSLDTTLQEMDWDGNVVWEVHAPSTLGKTGEVPDTIEYHHDHSRLANGNTLVLCHFDIDVPAISPNTLLDDFILEYDPDGNIVWEWYLHEHFDQMGFTDEQKALIAAVRPTRGRSGADWAHANSIEVLPENRFQADPRFAPGNIIVSLRAPNMVFIIDKNTGDIVWQIGPSDNLTIGQHWPHMNPIMGLDTDGLIIVFDNGGEVGYPSKYRSYSRVVEIDPLNKTVVREYDATHTGRIAQTFFSHIISGAQRLPNGNTLVDEGTSGRLFELDPTQTEIVWEFVSPFRVEIGTGGVFSANIYRAYRIDPTWIPGWTP